MHALSLDMGGTHIGCAVVRDREILAQTTIAPEGTGRLAPVWPQVVAALHSLLRQAAVSALDCAGLAIGFPGIVDVRTGTIYSTLKKYEDAGQMNLAGTIEETFRLPLRIENDARMALLGEQYAGAARNSKDVVMLTLGTGIGQAAMIDGRLVRGKHAQAANLGGHFTVDFEGHRCICGNIGCAEAEAAGWSLPGVAREWPGFAESSLASIPKIGFRELFEHAAHGDAVALALRQRCLRVWAAIAVSNSNAYDPELIVMGGGVMKSAQIILPFVQQSINDHTWSGWGKPQVRAAELGGNAGLLGAVPLLSEEIHAQG